MELPKGKCIWLSEFEEDGELYNVWHTNCGRKFEISGGTPEENNMEFCVFCGKQIEQAIKEAKDESV